MERARNRTVNSRPKLVSGRRFSHWGGVIHPASKKFAPHYRAKLSRISGGEKGVSGLNASELNEADVRKTVSDTGRRVAEFLTEHPGRISSRNLW